MGDAAVLWRLLRGMPTHGGHAERLEGFYGGQAEHYDRFRERLLHGRDALLAALPLPPGGVLVELGAGTGRNLEPLAPRLPGLAAVHLVDLCPSLLAVARSRVAARGWGNVRIHEADAVAWRPPQPADAVLCSYSLTMMPDWRAVASAALAMLRPGGVLAVVDFTVIDAAVAALGATRAQAAVLRWAWRRWFGHDGVHPDTAMLPWLAARLDRPAIAIGRHRPPYLPLRCAWFTLLGRLPNRELAAMRSA